jgi:uncharacterized protein DUF2188
VPKQGDVHVVPSERGWRVEVEGATRARSTHKTQAEAAKAARVIARRNKSELLIHGRNVFVAADQRVGREEVAIVDVLVGPADPAGADADEDLVRPWLGVRCVAHLGVSPRLVVRCPHGNVSVGWHSISTSVQGTIRTGPMRPFS